MNEPNTPQTGKTAKAYPIQRDDRERSWRFKLACRLPRMGEVIKL
jgi:hypothetical protein